MTDHHQDLSEKTKLLTTMGGDKTVPVVFPKLKKESGLYNFWALTWLVSWYIFSGEPNKPPPPLPSTHLMLIAGFTLFFNKYILTYLEGDPTLLGVMQMFATLVCGYLMMYSEGKDVNSVKPPGFVKHMAIVGGLRFCTVLAGLLALNYVAVSFTETVKSSAPAFTVVISRLILGQTSPFHLNS